MVLQNHPCVNVMLMRTEARVLPTFLFQEHRGEEGWFQSFPAYLEVSNQQSGSAVLNMWVFYSEGTHCHYYKKDI